MGPVCTEAPVRASLPVAKNRPPDECRPVVVRPSPRDCIAHHNEALALAWQPVLVRQASKTVCFPKLAQSLQNAWQEVIYFRQQE